MIVHHLGLVEKITLKLTRALAAEEEVPGVLGFATMRDEQLIVWAEPNARGGWDAGLEHGIGSSAVEKVASGLDPFDALAPIVTWAADRFGLSLSIQIENKEIQE